MYACMCQCLDRESLLQEVLAVGFWRVTQMQTGVPTETTADPLLAEMHFLNSSFAYGSSRSQKVVSLSSCESELHSMVSSMCDGIFIKACAEFILNEEVEHIQYTDSSSARQLACRQGSGRVRHLSGKILWVQEKTEDGSVVLRQVGTSENLADIGTTCLARQRLLYLMHETGLIYIPSFEDVGQEEFSRHAEKVGRCWTDQKACKGHIPNVTCDGP